MSTHRFPLRGKIGLVGGYNELASRLWARLMKKEKRERPYYASLDIEPLNEEQIRNLPIAHRYSA